MPGSNSPQSFVITGTNFDANCTVTLRDLTTGIVYANRTKISQTATSITLSPNFGVVADNWSVEVVNPGGVSSGQYAFQVIAPVPPVITATPQSQTITGGNNVTFSVAASGIPSPTFQWQLNGANIAGATSSTLTVNNAQLANAGYYSVVVSNSAGQVTSAAAKLTVLSNLDTVAPTLPTFAPTSPDPGTDSLVFITDGRTPNGVADIAWLNKMGTSIKQQVPSNWTVMTYTWVDDSTVPWWEVGLLIDRARKNGAGEGKLLADAALSLPGGKWQHIHFIAHSAGSALIEEASHIVKASRPDTVIHTTFLDPFMGGGNEERAHYGENSNWSDNYFSYSPVTIEEAFPWMFGALPHAHNVEVTGLDPAGGTLQYLASHNSTAATLPTSTHGWPINFYQNTIPPIPVNRLPGYEGYGFPLSAEARGSANWTSFPPNNNPPDVLAAQIGILQGSIPIVAGSLYDFSISTHAVGQTGLVQFNSSGFTATTSGTSPNPQSLRSSGSIQNSPAPASAPTGSPVWTSTPFDVTSNVNFVTFNAEFASQPGASGVLTVYWNDVEIGKIVERDALAGMQSYTMGITGAFFDRSNSLGFRLDQFSAVQSSVNVTNVTTGLGGLGNPLSLQIANMAANSTPALTLTGTMNYTFLIQVSQDLVNWQPMAVVTLDTAVSAYLSDPSASGVQARFYRAVSP